MAVVLCSWRNPDRRVGTFDLEAILFEKPFLIGVLGAIAVVVLGFLWLQTARRSVLYVLGVTLSVTIAAVIMAKLVVTDREAVEMTLNDIAASVARNDVPAVLEWIHPEAHGVRSQAQAEIPRYEFQEVKVKPNLEITFDKLDQPTEAVAKFNVLVMGSDRSGLFKNRRVPRYCIVTFRKHENSWRVFAYEHADAREGLLQR